MRPVSLSVDGCRGGPKGNGCSQVVPIDTHLSPFYMSVSVEVLGRVLYTVEHTYDDIWNDFKDDQANWHNAPNRNMVGSAKSGYCSYDAPITGVRVRISKGDGTAKMRVIHGGIAPEYASKRTPQGKMKEAPTRWQNFCWWLIGKLSSWV